MSSTVELIPIGWVRSSRSEAIDDEWDSVRSRIELDPTRFTPEALQGLETYSHVEVIFAFDQVADADIVTTARHPRGNKDWPKVGIFAQRGKNRPNRLGLTVCAIEKVDGLTLHLRGLDAIDGSPVLDIKPWMREFGPRGELRQPEWATELMKRYWE